MAVAPVQPLVPDVSGGGVVPWQERPTLVVTRRTMQRAETMLDVMREYGQPAFARTIPPLIQLLEDVAARARQLTIACEPDVPYHLIVRIVASALRAGITDVALAARRDEAMVLLPVTIATVWPTPNPQDLRVLVSFTKHEIEVFSDNGSEGTLQSPKLRVPRDRHAPRQIGAALRPLVAKRFSGARRASASAIAILGITDVTAQELAEMVAAVRGTASGEPLFPVVYLAGGFE